MALAYQDSEEVRAYLESEKGWEDMLHSAVRFIRVGGLRNFNLRNTKTIPWEVVREWLEQDFVKSWVDRNGPGEEHRYRSLVRTLAQEFYTSAHALQHGGDNSEAIWVAQPPQVEKIGRGFVPQFTDYVDLFHLDRENNDVRPLCVRLTGRGRSIFASPSVAFFGRSACSKTVAGPFSALIADVTKRPTG